MHYFIDTNVLLDAEQKFLDSLDKFYISIISLEQLENIKTSAHRDLEIKFKARKAIRWLINNQDKYIPTLYKEQFDSYSYFTVDNNDKKIIATVQYLNKERKEDLILLTDDLNCYILANSNNTKAQLYSNIKSKEKYKGYVRICCNTEDELADLYNNKLFSGFFDDLYVNEYILIYDQNYNLIDKYRLDENKKAVPVPFTSAKSKMFGNIKPIDPYQELVMDSFKNNILTLIKGPAGSGKSILSISYLFKCLEEGKIDKIIIFCNTVATAGSARLGYYPGSRTEKLLDSQIGNFLISKLGDRFIVEKLIDEGKLLLLPMSDIRGFDTSGMKAGIYITQAQNLNVELMKLALQRIGEDSICILDGDDLQQVDLNIYAGQNNGLKRVSEVFRGQSFYGEVYLQTIHRSKIAEIASRM